jgi:hypothetical protein
MRKNRCARFSSAAVFAMMDANIAVRAQLANRWGTTRERKRTDTAARLGEVSEVDAALAARFGRFFVFWQNRLRFSPDLKARSISAWAETDSAAQKG